MTCEEALKKLYEVIDKEADQVDVQKVKEHLDQCKSCMSRYEFESMFKTFVEKKASSPAKSDDLRKKIMTRIDEAEKGGGRFSNPFRFGAVMVAVAAALVICIVAAFSTAEFYRHKTQLYPFEKIHLNSELPVDYGSGAINVASEIYPAGNGMHVGFNCACPTLEYVGSREVEVNGFKLAHLQCTCNGDYVSLLVGKADEIHLPDFEKVIIGGNEYFRHTCDECTMLYWYVNDAIVIAVTKKPNLDMSTLVTSVEPI